MNRLSTAARWTLLITLPLAALAFLAVEVAMRLHGP